MKGKKQKRQRQRERLSHKVSHRTDRCLLDVDKPEHEIPKSVMYLVQKLLEPITLEIGLHGPSSVNVQEHTMSCD